MGIIAVAVQHLIAAGVTGDALVRAIAEMEDTAAAPAVDPVIEKRRAYDRERKRRDAEEKRNSTGIPPESAGIPAESAEFHGNPALSLPPNDNNSNPPTHTHPDMTPRAREADPFPKPEWADPQHWRDLKANRKAKRLPNTATAHAKLLRDIAKLTDDAWPPGRLLEAIVARGWAAAYDPRENRNHGNHDIRPSREPGPDRRNSLTRACDDALDFLG